MDALVVAGATRNPVDAVRYLSARSSGRTGVAVARGLRDRGVRVLLLGSPEALLRGPEIPGEEYGSTRDLLARMEGHVRAVPGLALVHAAAVGDYEVAARADKVPSGLPEWSLALRPTPKIADLVRPWGLRGPYVTFKAAAPGTSRSELEALARAQRERTGCDLVFANVLDHLGSDVLLVGHSTRHFARRDEAVAALVDWVSRRLGA